MRGPSGGVLMDRVVSDAAGSTMALDPRKQSDDSSSDPHLRSVGSSSSLSSTVYEDDADALPTANTTNNNNQAVPVATSTDKTLGFESSAFFRFADFGATSTTTASAATTDDFFAPTTLDKKDVPSNQTTHDDPEDGEADDVVPPTTPVLPIHHHHHRINVASRRKNSIEMFLSQSPSQALGGGFLKMALDDDDPPPPPPELELGASSTTKASAGGVATTVSARVGGNAGGSAATSAAVTAPYGYLLSRNSPAVDTDDEWSSTSSQEMLSSNTSASAYYYAESQAALHHQQSQQAFGYGASDGFRYGNEGYSAGARTTHHQTTWNSSPYNTGMAVPSASQPSYASMSPAASAYGHGRYQQAPPMHPYPQQPSQHAFHHQQQGTGHRGHNGGRPAYSRSQSMYATSNPASRMMMDSSPPPPSPAPGMYGVKQCKFFLQGHCRMGNKCKFAHHSPQHPSVAQQSPYMHQQHSQSFRLAQPSPASSPSHHSQHDFDTMAATQSSFMPRGGSNRPLYRTNSTDIQQSLVSPHHHAHQHNAQGAVGALVHGDEVLAVEDVHGRVFAMSKDQNGCRLLQEQLEYYEERKQLCDVIYLEAMDHLAEMMVDPFGNYLFQKLLERAKPLQRLEMVRRVSGHLVAAALNLHGTRSVQKVVEVCATSAQVVELDSDGRESRRVNLPDLIVEALKDDAVRLCIDSNGNHVIQRALQFMKPEYNQFVFDAVAKECTTVGTHRHGCCVLQRCLDAANDQQKREVITQVEKQAMKLMQDPYGNYVVQYVLDSCSAEEAFGVISKPLGSVFELSIQKFSSNVIEKCLEKAPPSVLAQYVDEITHCPKMQKMLQDQFANYVVQRALCVATEDQCMTLVKAIRPHLAAMKNTSGGRRITARILKRFPHMDLSLDLGFGPATHGDAYGMATNAYGMHPDHHHQYQTQYQYGSSYGVMPSIRSDGSDSGMPSFASSSGTLGLRLHDNGSVGHRM